jgi:formyl-CoA transferase
MTTDEIIEQGVQLYQAFSAAGSPDITSAVAVSTALSLGLYAREVTGKGQYMESSMLFSNCYCCSEDFMRFDAKQPRLNPDKELRGLHALHRLYEAKDGWVFLQCPKEDEWKEFCKAIDRQDLLKEPRYNTPVSRLTNDDQLIGQLAPIFKTRSADDWEDYLLKRDIMCVRADKPGVDDFFLSDPAVKENGFSAAVNHPILGKSVRVGPPSRFSLTPSRAEPPVLFGQNTQAIMADLGYSKTAIAELKAKGIVGGETESAK